MSILRPWGVLLAFMLVAVPNICAHAQLTKGESAPMIRAEDVFGKQVELDALIQKGCDLVILYFFTPAPGDTLALTLEELQEQYGAEQLQIVALGLREDEEALRGFAQALGIDYYIIDEKQLAGAPWLGAINAFPTTAFVVANESRTIERVLQGGGSSTAKVIQALAENYFQQRKLDMAGELATKASGEAEVSAEAKELKGFVLTAQGKLDEAEQEFQAIDSKAGLAAVELERGNLDGAVELASASSAPYAKVVESRALLQQGETAASEAAASAALAASDAPSWQASEAANAKGRAAHVSGAADTAVSSYEQAVALDPYNVVALSNEAALHREQGNLAEAEASLAKAASIREDAITAELLEQVRAELAAANDVKRQELIRQQIKDLAARYDEIKQAGGAPLDSWSTRPPVLAMLPVRTGATVLERAGTEVALQRRIESALTGKAELVERQMLDLLLQELQLGTSELTDQSTQRRIGQVVSAGLMGELSFAPLGNQLLAYFKLIDTETTGYALSLSEPLDPKNPLAVADKFGEALSAYLAKRDMQGLIAQAEGDEVYINLGTRHGVENGQQFTVLLDGKPLQAGGRVINAPMKEVGTLVVTNADVEFSICKVESLLDGVKLAQDMKVRAKAK